MVDAVSSWAHNVFKYRIMKCWIKPLEGYQCKFFGNHTTCKGRPYPATVPVWHCLRCFSEKIAPVLKRQSVPLMGSNAEDRLTTFLGIYVVFCVYEYNCFSNLVQQQQQPFNSQDSQKH